jgi:signal transduction histidine kinase
MSIFNQHTNARRAVILGVIFIATIALCVRFSYLIFESPTISWPNFFLLFGLLLLGNLVLILSVWFPMHRAFGMRGEIALILWGSIVMWYWGVAPLFHYLSITVNELQFQWSAIIFLWEVPVLGLFFIGHAIRKFVPIEQAFSGTGTKDPEAMYRRLVTYPGTVASIEFAWGIIGYTIGTIQLHLFADFPVVEGVKNIANGFALSFFFGLILYVLLDGHLAGVRTAFKKRYHLPPVPYRRIAYRIFGLTLLAATGTMILLGLLTFKSWQGIIQKELLVRMREDAMRAVFDLSEAPDEDVREQILMRLAREFRRGERGRTFSLPEDTEELRMIPLSPEIKDAALRGGSAVLLDQQDESKVVAVLYDIQSDKRLVSVVFLSEFYWVLGEPMKFFLLGALLLVVLISFMSVFVSYYATRAFRGFTAAVRAEDTAHIAGYASGDELEEVALAIAASMDEARDLREKLESRVREQTAELGRRSDELAEKHEALEQEYVRSEALLQSIGEAVLAVDSEGRIIFTNQIAADLFEKQPEELTGSSLLHGNIALQEVEDMTGRPVPLRKRPIFRALETGKRHSRLLYQVARSGRRVATQATATPLILRGEIIGAVTVWRDVTEERRVVRAQTEFVSIASHQFRTPLSILRWYAEVLLSHELGNLSPRQQKFVSEIHRATRRLSTLVDTILQITKIELGSLPLTGTQTDIVAVLEDIIAQYAQEIEQKKLYITKRYDTDIPPLRINNDILSIILSNLFENAVHYTPPSASIEIDILIDREKSSSEREGKTQRSVHIRIADTGYGIPEDEQPLIFSRLFRASNVEDKEIEGTGMGLYIVKLILDRIGGSIRFESTPDVGTTFHITIPVRGS